MAGNCANIATCPKHNKYVKNIKKFVTNPKHLIIDAPHPSPLSAYHGFFGSKIFSKTCDYLNEPFDIWRLP